MTSSEDGFDWNFFWVEGSSTDKLKHSLFIFLCFYFDFFRAFFLRFLWIFSILEGVDFYFTWFVISVVFSLCCLLFVFSFFDLCISKINNRRTWSEREWKQLYSWLKTSERQQIPAGMSDLLLWTTNGFQVNNDCIPSKNEIIIAILQVNRVKGPHKNYRENNAYTQWLATLHPLQGNMMLPFA